MWVHEARRIGKRKCTPTGYVLHIAADFIGFAGLALAVATHLLLVRKGIVETFRTADLRLFALPIGLGLAGEILLCNPWRMASRKGYDFG